MHPLAQLVRRRVALTAVLLMVVSGSTFVLVSLSPGDPAEQILGFNATPESIARLRSAMGLNQPLWDQYWNWIRSAATGDLGTSISTGTPVADAISARLPVTLSLVAGALLVTSLLGVGGGVLASLRGGGVARAVDAVALLGFALPSFWLASGMVALFAVRLGWFPAIGYVPLAESPAGWLRSLVLPIAALALPSIAFVAKQTRESMAGALDSEYVRMGRAHGVPDRSLIGRHALRNAAMPVVTVIGVQAVGLLAGTLFVENVFSLPGLGSLLVQSALGHDVPVVMGITMTITLLVVAVNAVVDLAYTWLNPRVRTS
ncbi:ABC transporter permease [Kribbella solani]|uniref:Peptide/nickel transport system permease protein n=1 Tax=Kribbella solani TaxID=236067 RepID=A0A841DKN9_9ACTN|nr:ABC transporter permease [Kribbella solani]MBB5977346.1 peptide/nickel transport system permease protein [Kribbella solani]